MFKHRATVAPGYAHPMSIDPSSQARCADFGFDSCDGGVCPRHNPVVYAEMMARHATDSITYRRVDSDRESAFHNFGVTR